MDDSLSAFRVIGALSNADRADMLRELGEDEVAKDIERRPADEADGLGGLGLWGDAELHPWEHVAHHFGFVPPAKSKEPLPIVPVGQIDSQQPSLAGKRIDIKLKRMFAAEYPGKGLHNVLFNFAATNQIADDNRPIKESLQFNLTVRARNGELTAEKNLSIFLGMTAEDTGITIHCKTLNVKNDDDERLLAVINSSVVTEGLSLLTSLQPAVVPLAGISKGIFEALAKRNRNIGVQSFKLGLDSNDDSLGVRLVEGTYFAVQAPAWNWAEYSFDTERDQIVYKDKLVPMDKFNYVSFGIGPSPILAKTPVKL